MEILLYLDERERWQREDRARVDLILSSAVASGVMTAPQAWPSYFKEPDGGAYPQDGEGLILEHATPESYAADIEAMIASSQRVVMSEDRQPSFPGPPQFPHPEWA